MFLGKLDFSIGNHHQPVPAGNLQDCRALRVKHQASGDLLLTFRKFSGYAAGLLLIGECHHGRTVVLLIIARAGTASVKDI